MFGALASFAIIASVTPAAWAENELLTTTLNSAPISFFYACHPPHVNWILHFFYFNQRDTYRQSACHQFFVLITAFFWLKSRQTGKLGCARIWQL
ncbi:hypothetical protein ACFS07_31760 [Undibacterium arcticum]